MTQIVPRYYALSERAIACKHWRWMPGMVCMDPPGYPKFGDQPTSRIQILRVDPSGWPWESAELFEPDSTRIMGWIRDGTLPDLTNPATLGCLLALVRDAYKDAFVSVHPEGNNTWLVSDCEGYHIASGRSESEALVNALEEVVKWEEEDESEDVDDDL